MLLPSISLCFSCAVLEQRVEISMILRAQGYSFVNPKKWPVSPIFCDFNRAIFTRSSRKDRTRRLLRCGRKKADVIRSPEGVGTLRAQSRSNEGRFQGSGLYYEKYFSSWRESICLEYRKSLYRKNATGRNPQVDSIKSRVTSDTLRDSVA